MDNIQLPVVDISPVGVASPAPSEADLRAVGQELGEALSQIGFICLTGHGVDEELITKTMQISKQFFEQKNDVKEQLMRRDQESLEGWVAQGREIFDQDETGFVAVHEIREAFDINSLSENAKFPDSSLPDFRDICTELARKSMILAHRLLQCISFSLGKDQYYLDDLHKRILSGKNASALRSLYYPPIIGEVPQDHVRCGEHSDYGTLTLLYRDQHPGLQLKNLDGIWVSADPVPGTILVNIGDLLEMWSGGVYPATMHRVVIPNDERLRASARQSIPFFVHPDEEVIVKPLMGNTNKFPKIKALDHANIRFNQTYKY